LPALWRLNKVSWTAANRLFLYRDGLSVQHTARVCWSGVPAASVIGSKNWPSPGASRRMLVCIVNSSVPR
jgi:hypothetical protein